MKLLRFLPALFCMAIIFYFSSQPPVGLVQEPTTRFILLKSLHTLGYIALSIAYQFGFRSAKTSLLASLLYAASDEFHQSFIPGRNARITDVLIDFFGAIIGILLLTRLKKIPILSAIFFGKF